MNPYEDQKLEAFLKENRPLHPRHSEREAEKTWALISKSKAPVFWGPAYKVFGALATVAIFVAVINLDFQQQPEPDVLDETALVEESLDLDFLENGEIYEVTDLLSLAK